MFGFVTARSLRWYAIFVFDHPDDNKVHLLRIASGQVYKMVE
jgi:hypothetical protein